METKKIIVWTHSADEILAEFQKYNPRLDYEDTLEYVKEFLKYREIYTNDPIPSNSAQMKSMFECIYSNLKAEAVKRNITEEDFSHLADICRD